MTLFWRKLHSVNHGSSRLSPDHLLDEGRRGEAKGPYFTYDSFINAMFFSVYKYACLKLVCSAWRKKFKIIKKKFRRLCDILLHSEYCGIEGKLSTNLNQFKRGNNIYERKHDKSKRAVYFHNQTKILKGLMWRKSQLLLLFIVLNHLATRKPVTARF